MKPLKHLSQIVFWYTASGLYNITLRSSSARLDGIHPVQPDSPDLRSVRNKEVKFVWIYSLGPDLVRCPH